MMLQDFDENDPRRGYIEEIHHAGLRGRDLVRQLLAFSRKQTMDYKPISLNEVVKGFEKLLRRTIREEINIEINLSSDAHFVMADIGQIEQVIMNLAINAADAMPTGGNLTLETSNIELTKDYMNEHQGTKPGQYVLLSIGDTGCGMDKETSGHVFEPFFSTKGEKGTGLGLATVYGIIKQHGGRIDIFSELRVGTIFNIYLPVANEKEMEEEALKEKVYISDLRGSETVLIVDDDTQVLELTQTILKRQGYDIIVVKNGYEALNALRLKIGEVHLLLTDVMMPDITGIELAILALKSHPNLKILFMSGHTFDEVSCPGILENESNFIHKPFSLQALAVKMREILEKK